MRYCGLVKITVGIVFYNEIKQLNDCLASLLEVSNSNFFGELILVVNSQGSEELSILLNKTKNKLGYGRLKVVYNLNNNFIILNSQ